MDKVTILYDNLERGEPFCFIKLNDGEISALMNFNSSLSRGDELSSLKMSNKIKECLEYDNKNYFIGLPCSLCYNEYYNEAKKYISSKYSFQNNILNANILINTNIDSTIDILMKTMKNKQIVIVTNETNAKNINKLEALNIVPYKIVCVSDKYAFNNDYERVKDECKNFNNNDIVICLCGPLGRILSYEWFKQNNTLTCLELGSLFDPLLRNKAYLYHTGTHKYCSECFPSNDADDCKLLSLCQEKLEKECYYFSNEPNNFIFYNYNFKKIRKNNDIRLEKEPNDLFLLRLKTLCDEKERTNNKNNVLVELTDGHKLFEVNYIQPKENNKPFYIVYHIATVNDKWMDLTTKSYNNLLNSGILFEENLKQVIISYLGEEENIQLFKDIWKHPKVNVINNGNDCKLYEYPAINLIKDVCRKEDCNILYFHCKGQLHEKDVINDWIEFLEYFNIERWKYCLNKLIDYDVVGCNYYGRTEEKNYRPNPYPFTLNERHFSGNFWWCKSSYINTLEPLKYNKEDRYEPEFWLLSNEYAKIWSYYVASIDFSKKERPRLTRDIYVDLENLEFNFYLENNYKQYSKNELFNICERSYHLNKLSRLSKASEVYLSLFETIEDEQVNKVKFFNGFSYFFKDKNKAKKQFKLLYNSSSVSDEYRFYAKCNLEMIYKKNDNKIPKIIHLIYLKGIDFMDFHYGCVKSMIKNMPDYKIIIYNDVEPVNNKYWNDIKNYVTIQHIEPPNTFDDYPLKYIQYKADVIRLELLYEHGGIYLDLDMLIIKNFDNIFNTGKDFYISEEGEKGEGLINSFLACKPKNGFIKKWLESFKIGLRMDNWAYHIRESNKMLLDNNKHYFIKYNIEIIESKYFFPFKWSDKEKFININENLNDDIYGVHLYETILCDILQNNKYFDNYNEI